MTNKYYQNHKEKLSIKIRHNKNLFDKQKQKLIEYRRNCYSTHNK